MLTLATAIFGFVISCLLIFFVRHHRFVNRFLGIAFFALSFRSLSIYLLYEHYIPDSYLIGSVSFVYYWIVPMIYLYVRSVTNGEVDFSGRDWIHFIIPVLAGLLALGYLVEGFLNTGQWNVPLQAIRSEPGTNGWPVPVIWHGLLIFIAGSFYTVLCWRLVLRRFFLSIPVNRQAIRMRNWVCMLMVMCTLLMLALVLEPFLYFIAGANTYVHLMGIRSVILIFIFSQVVINSKLLYGMPEDSSERRRTL